MLPIFAVRPCSCVTNFDLTIRVLWKRFSVWCTPHSYLQKLLATYTDLFASRWLHFSLPMSFSVCIMAFSDTLTPQPLPKIQSLYSKYNSQWKMFSSEIHIWILHCLYTRYTTLCIIYFGITVNAAKYWTNQSWKNTEKQK